MNVHVFPTPDGPSSMRLDFSIIVWCVSSKGLVPRSGSSSLRDWSLIRELRSTVSTCPGNSSRYEINIKSYCDVNEDTTDFQPDGHSFLVPSSPISPPALSSPAPLPLGVSIPEFFDSGCKSPHL